MVSEVFQPSITNPSEFGRNKNGYTNDQLKAYCKMYDIVCKASDKKKILVRNLMVLFRWTIFTLKILEILAFLIIFTLQL